jgi:hypothetical protein
LDELTTPKDALTLFWSKEPPQWRIQPAVLVQANGRRQAIAALQNGFAVGHVPLGAFGF